MTTLRRMPRRFRLWMAAGILFVLLGPGTAAAANGVSHLSSGSLADQTAPSASGFDFGVRPDTSPGALARGEFDYQLSPGQVISDRVAVVNLSGAPKTFFIYSADAYTTDIGASFALRLRTDPATDIATWIKLTVAAYTVPARSQSLVPFSVAVPLDATPGDHTAGIVAEELPSSTTATQGAALAPVHRVAARVYLRVAGPLHPALDIDNLAVGHGQPLIPFLTGKGSTTVGFTIVNSGNTRVQLDQIEVKLTGLFGHPVHQAAVNRPAQAQTAPSGLPDQILPGSKLRLTRTFVGLPPLDIVTAYATVKVEDPVLHQPLGEVRSATFWVIPWLVLAIVVVFGGAWAILRRRRRRSPGPPSNPPPLPGGGRPAEPAAALPVS